jgi:hypothetical protein
MTGRPRSRLLLAAVCVLALGACAMTSSYNQSYLAAARRSAALQADGRALIVTTAEDDAYVYSGHPTSFTGAATTLTMPLGSIIKESATAAFADTFKGGAEAGHVIKDADRYVVIVAPKLKSFSYEYNAAKNVGFAITPTASVVVDLRVLDAKGEARWQRSYQSGPVEGPAYVLNTSPQEEVSKVTHKALYDLFSAAAADIARGAASKAAGAATD